MKAPTIYEKNASLYGYDAFLGKPAQLQYLPTERARKWRNGAWFRSYSPVAYETGMALLQAGEIAAFRFVEG